MNNNRKTVCLKPLDDNGAYIFRFTPSIFEVVPAPYKKHFSLSERGKLLFRLIRGYWFYYIADSKELYAYDFIKKDYLNTYAFMKKGDVISNPNFTFPERRGKGYAGILFRAVIEDRDTSWKKLWGVIKDDNIPSIKAAKRAGFQLVGYSKKDGYHHVLTDDKTKLEVYCCERD